MAIEESIKIATPNQQFVWSIAPRSFTLCTTNMDRSAQHHPELPRLNMGTWRCQHCSHRGCQLHQERKRKEERKGRVKAQQQQQPTQQQPQQQQLLMEQLQQQQRQRKDRQEQQPAALPAAHLQQPDAEGLQQQRERQAKGKQERGRTTSTTTTSTATSAAKEATTYQGAATTPTEFILALVNINVTITMTHVPPEHLCVHIRQRQTTTTADSICFNTRSCHSRHQLHQRNQQWHLPN